MSNNEILARQSMEFLKNYREKHSPTERFRHMVERGIINEKGEVLMNAAERKAGRPLSVEDGGCGIESVEDYQI